MKIIYDEAKAIARKQQIKQEVQETNAKIHKKNIRITVIVWTIAIMLCVVAIIVCYPMITKALNDAAGAPIPTAILSLSYVAVPGAFYLMAEWLVCAITERYHSCDFPSEVRYYIATHDKNVLKVDFKPAAKAGNVEIVLIYEDENHIVCTQEVCWLTCKQSTAVTEITADLENGLYLVPYNKEKS